MTEHDKLRADVERFEAALAQQRRKDATHEVLICALAADLRRARARLAEHEAQRQPASRRYTDGRLAA